MSHMWVMKEVLGPLTVSRYVAMALVIETGGACLAMADCPYLSDAQVNTHWFSSQADPTLVFVPDGQNQQAVLSLKSGEFKNKRVVLEMLTDAASCVLAGGKALALEIPLEPDRRNVIELNGSAQSPSVTVNGREMVSLRGRWIGLVLKNNAEELTLTCPDAQYAHVLIGASSRGGAKIPTGVARAVFGDAASQASSETAPSTRISAAEGGRPTPGEQEMIQPVRVAEPATTMGAVPGDNSEIIEHKDRWRLSLSAGVDTMSAYYYRGIGRENQNIILEPWLATRLRIFDNSWSTEPNNVLDYVDLNFGFRGGHFWGPYGGDGTTGEKWQEFDWYGGVTFGFLQRWAFTIDYDNMESIRTAYRDVHQFNFTLAFDDRDPNYNWSLNPYATVSVEYENQSDGGWISNANSTSSRFQTGTYLELGARPEFKLFDLSPDKPVMMAVPARVGMSLANYYEDTTGHDDFFGYFETGVDLKIPLANIPADGGRSFRWMLTLGCHVMVLGDSARDLSKANGTGEASVVPIGNIGLSLDF